MKTILFATWPVIWRHTTENEPHDLIVGPSNVGLGPSSGVYTGVAIAVFFTLLDDITHIRLRPSSSIWR